MNEQDQALRDVLEVKGQAVLRAFSSLPAGTSMPKVLLDALWSWLDTYTGPWWDPPKPGRRDLLDDCRALDGLAKSIEIWEKTIEDGAQKVFLSRWAPKTQH